MLKDVLKDAQKDVLKDAQKDVLKDLQKDAQKDAISVKRSLWRVCAKTGSPRNRSAKYCRAYKELSDALGYKDTPGKQKSFIT